MKNSIVIELSSEQLEIAHNLANEVGVTFDEAMAIISTSALAEANKPSQSELKQESSGLSETYAQLSELYARLSLQYLEAESV